MVWKGVGSAEVGRFGLAGLFVHFMGRVTGGDRMQRVGRRAGTCITAVRPRRTREACTKQTEPR